MKDIHTESGYSPFLNKIFGLLTELRETRDGRIMYEYLSRSLVDWEAAHNKTNETYLGFIRLLLEAISTVLPPDSVIKTHLKLILARMEPPVTEFELAELNDALEEAADILCVSHTFPTDKLVNALGPVVHSITEKVKESAKPVPKPTPKSAKTGKFPAPNLNSEPQKVVAEERHGLGKNAALSAASPAANSSNLFSLDGHTKIAPNENQQQEKERETLGKQSVEQINRWTETAQGENVYAAMRKPNEQATDKMVVNLDDETPGAAEQAVNISSHYRAHLDDAREQMLRLQKDFVRQMRSIVAQSAEFGVSLELEIDVLRDAQSIEDIESRRRAIIHSLEKLSHSHTDLAKKFDTAQSYLSIIESDNNKLSEELDRVRLLSLTDELTSLPNRRAFTQKLEDEVSRVKRYGFPLSLVLIDIDHFKQINDKFGHVAGDAMLRAYADKILSIFRHHDMVARYGGEEFGVILPNTELKGVLRALTKVKSRVPEVFVKVNGLTIPAPHFSAGVCEYKTNELPEQFIERADHALYRAKRLGRNRIEVAEKIASPQSIETPAGSV